MSQLDNLGMHHKLDSFRKYVVFMRSPLEEKECHKCGHEFEYGDEIYRGIYKEGIKTPHNLCEDCAEIMVMEKSF